VAQAGSCKRDQFGWPARLLVVTNAADSGGDRVILFGEGTDLETAAFDDTGAYDYDRDRWTRLGVDGPGRGPGTPWRSIVRATRSS
jgi:hypothetical protein